MECFGKQPWKPVKVQKKVKLVRRDKKPIEMDSIFNVFKSVFSALFRPRARVQAPSLMRWDKLAFMSVVIKVNPARAGWQRAVLRVLRTCEGSRFKMDQNGVVEVSAIADPNKLLQRLGRSRRVELHWFQFGQCAEYLFMPQPKKEPVRQKPDLPNYYNSYTMNPQLENYYSMNPPRLDYGYPVHGNQLPGYNNYNYYPPPPPPPRLLRRPPPPFAYF